MFGPDPVYHIYYRKKGSKRWLKFTKTPGLALGVSMLHDELKKNPKYNDYEFDIKEARRR